MTLEDSQQMNMSLFSDSLTHPEVRAAKCSHSHLHSALNSFTGIQAESALFKGFLIAACSSVIFLTLSSYSSEQHLIRVVVALLY